MQPFDVRVASPTPQSIHQRMHQWSLTDLTVSIPSSSSKNPTSTIPRSTGSRWRTKEFYLYYLIFLIVVPNMYYSAVKVSSSKNPLYPTYQHKLSKGWLFGSKIDNSDHQYYLFRSHLPLLTILFTLYLSLSHISRRILPQTRTCRSYFILSFSLCMLAALHGTSLIKMLVILYANWSIARLAFEEKRGRVRREWVPFLTWGFNVGMLFANSIYGGYEFGSISASLAWLDDYKGLLPRWQIMWNISMLRIISFNMELYWSTIPAPPPSSPSSVPLTSRPRPQQPQQTPTISPDPILNNFSFPLFLSYVFYPPLYLAGPILTYPSYLSQLTPSTTSTSSSDESSSKAILRYGLRFLISLGTMEVVLHSMYVVAIKDSPGEWWKGLGPMQVSMIGFWNLIIVWLKLLIPWRYFRLVSLMDGINPPENMVRCMANNYSTLGFWRSWHRSYNLWIIRYLYVPLGGSKRPILSTLVVFTFVALWHDLSMRLLAWGWIISLFVLPEMLCTTLISYKKYGEQWWYRHLAAIGGVFNVLLMMTANLVGFVVGIDGAKGLWKKMLGTIDGRVFMGLASGCLFVAVQVMFEYREEERRKGVNRRC
ncbi:hypothetical protein JCM5353_005315 [Sporobolomyces roseus]